MINSSIESNNQHVKQIECIQVNHVAPVPPHAFWLQRQRKTVYNLLGCAYRDYTSGSDAEKRLMTVASMMQELQERLMSLLDNHHTSSLTYWRWCKLLNQDKEPFNAWFTILNDEKTLQTCANVSSCLLEVAIQTCPHPEKYCIISW